MNLVTRMAEMIADDEGRSYLNDVGLYDRKARRWFEALLKDEAFPFPDDWLRDELKQHFMGMSPADRIL